jgi:hypothetical protein
MTENSLAPWIRLPEAKTLSDYCALTQLVSASTSAQIERTGSIDDTIASAVINSLRFEMENAQEMVMYLEQKLRKARGDDE